jgi:hypothetical protein
MTISVEEYSEVEVRGGGEGLGENNEPVVPISPRQAMPIIKYHIRHSVLDEKRSKRTRIIKEDGKYAAAAHCVLNNWMR